MLKRITLVVVAVALLLSAGLAGVWLHGQGSGPAIAQTTQPEYSPAQTITVLGRGSARSEPDIAGVALDWRRQERRLPRLWLKMGPK